MNQGAASYQYQSALRVADSDMHSNADKAAVLHEVAMGIGHNATTANDHSLSIALLERALTLSALDSDQKTSIELQLASSLFHHTLADEDGLQRIAGLLLAATASPDSETSADAFMLRGLVLQTLAIECGHDYREAVASYDKALCYFAAEQFPVEYSIIQNNLATLWLSLRDSGLSAHSFEALAVNAFETALACISAESNPEEFAMLSNNLGNALQYADEEHALANNVRALEAYDAALAIRRRSGESLSLANTLANRANCIARLPDAPLRPECKKPGNLVEAIANAGEARSIFSKFGEQERSGMMTALIVDLEAELAREGANGYCTG